MNFPSARLIARETVAMIGTRFGHYEITGKLGEGGMGVVYRAKDLQLGRDVALKLVPPAFGADPERIARFEREARVLASLNHPNIAQIYGLETDGDSRALVMELVDGPTLAERLAAGPLPFHECIEVAVQIAHALAEAHARGIVHRDLKPQNIKLTHSGSVKVLDFGLARRQANGLDDQTVEGTTATGMIVGTVGYMPPEQVRGEAIDSRADIFAFGCVLYEMATGRRAFEDGSAVEILSAILHKSVVPPSRRRRELPSGFDRVVEHCLAKEADARFQSARDLQFALGALEETNTRMAQAERAASVAVLPFVNLSADPENEFFADGITEDVIAHLAKIRSIKVISRTSVMTFKKRDRSLREIGEKLGAATLVEGSVRRAGNRVRIVAQLIEATTDEHIWAETYDRDLTDIFAIQTDVALNIANALRAELSHEERDRVRQKPTYDLEAYGHFVRGRNAYYRFDRMGFQRSVVEYEAAIAKDPNFALAWAAAAESRTEMSIQGYMDRPEQEETIRLARKEAARAIELDNHLAEAHAVSAFIRFVFDFDWEGAERDFKQALALSPGSADIHDHYSWLCYSQERYDEAVREVQRARELDPLLIQSDVATALLRAGRLDEALEETRRSTREEPRSPRCHSTLGWALIFRGEHAAGLAALEHAVALAPGNTMFVSQLGQACASIGETERARAILEQLKERAKREFVSPYHFAYVLTGLKEYDGAMDWLEQAYEKRSGAIYGIKGSFLFRDLHGHPRFEGLLRKMNLA